MAKGRKPESYWCVALQSKSMRVTSFWAIFLFVFHKYSTLIQQVSSVERDITMYNRRLLASICSMNCIVGITWAIWQKHNYLISPKKPRTRIVVISLKFNNIHKQRREYIAITG